MSKLARLAVVPVAVLALAACGGSSSAPSPSPTGAPGNGRGFGGVDFAAVQACLKAAGVAVPTPSGGFPTNRPSNRPSNRPTNLPRPSGTGGFRNGPGGGMRGVFASKQAQAALKACGITIPTGRPGNAPAASTGA